MSGRKGIGIKADDFIDMVEKKSFQEIESRNPSIPKNEINNIAKLIAAAAIRYYMLKFSRNKIIVFDIEEALNFDGETGPYLQYAAVRANNILNKLREKNFQIPPLAESVPHYIEDNFYSQDFLPIWDLIFNLSLIKNVAIKSLDTLELLIFAKFIYSLAQKFNYFYYHYDVIHMNDEERMFRSFIVNLFKHQYSNALNILGIPIPPRM
jgi:arginyl-tRNA synthetase